MKIWITIVLTREFSDALLGERDVHDARRLHLSWQPGAASGALGRPDIYSPARARDRPGSNDWGHQVRPYMRQSARSPACNLPHLLQQQARAKNGQYGRLIWDNCAGGEKKKYVGCFIIEVYSHCLRLCRRRTTRYSPSCHFFFCFFFFHNYLLVI